MKKLIAAAVMTCSLNSISFAQLNQAPEVGAGSDQSMVLPVDARLSGWARDTTLPAGPLKVTWSKMSGPGVAVFAKPNSMSTNVTLVLPGTYIFRLTATDGLLSAIDDTMVTALPVTPIPPTPFIRGDANFSGIVDVSDVSAISDITNARRKSSCLKAADANDDGTLTTADSEYLANFLYRGGPKPKSPFPVAGLDPTVDTLPCGSFLSFY